MLRELRTELGARGAGLWLSHRHAPDPARPKTLQGATFRVFPDVGSALNEFEAHGAGSEPAEQAV